MVDAWAVGDNHADDESLRPLYATIDALVRRGLREQCAQWPAEWSTDGVVAYGCARTGIRSIEVIGLCSAFTAQRGAFARFPIRASFEINVRGDGLSWFRCDVGDLDSVAPGAFPELPIGSVILFESEEMPDDPIPHVLAGRQSRAIVWTTVITLPETP